MRRLFIAAWYVVPLEVSLRLRGLPMNRHRRPVIGSWLVSRLAYYMEAAFGLRQLGLFVVASIGSVLAVLMAFVASGIAFDWFLDGYGVGLLAIIVGVGWAHYYFLYLEFRPTLAQCFEYVTGVLVLYVVGFGWSFGSLDVELAAHAAAGGLKGTALAWFPKDPDTIRLARLGEIRCLLRSRRYEFAALRVESYLRAESGGVSLPHDAGISPLVLMVAPGEGDERLWLLLTWRDSHGHSTTNYDFTRLGSKWEEEVYLGRAWEFCRFYCMHPRAYPCPERSDPSRDRVSFWRPSLRRTEELVAGWQQEALEDLRRPVTSSREREEKMAFLARYPALVILAAEARRRPLPPAFHWDETPEG